MFPFIFQYIFTRLPEKSIRAISLISPKKRRDNLSRRFFYTLTSNFKLLILFLDGEVRYNALKRANPEKAEKLFAQNEKEAMERYAYLKKLVTLYGEE